MASTDEFTVYEGTRKEYKTALILFSLVTIISYVSDGLMLLAFMVITTFVLRFMNKRDFIARRRWVIIYICFAVWTYAESIIMGKLINLPEYWRTGGGNTLFAVIFSAIAIYGWIVYFKSATWVEGAAKAATVTTPAATASVVSTTTLASTAATSPEASSLCPHCGSALNPGAKFCSECGSKVL